MGRFFASKGSKKDSQGFFISFHPSKDHSMSSHLKSYGIFLAMLIATKVIVAPMAKQSNIPFLSDL